MSSSEDILKCNICLETMIMTDCRMLPSCGHMFCIVCLQKHAGYQREIFCPACRVTCRVPPGGVREFPKNFILNQFLEKLCEQCGEYPRTDRCPHCDKMMCSRCRGRHMTDLRTELTNYSQQVEQLNDVKILKEAKHEKKCLSEKQKNLDRELTKAADDLVKVIRAQEKRMKSQVKQGFTDQIRDIDAKVKSYQDDIATLKQFTKKYDLKSIPDEKVEEMKTKWSAHFEEIFEQLDDTVTVVHKDVTCSIDQTEVENYIVQNWKLLRGDGSELSMRSLSISSMDDTSSLSSRVPQIDSLPLKDKPVCVFGGNGKARGKFQSPFGVAVSPVTNQILITDTLNHRIQMFDTKGHVTAAIDSTGTLQISQPVGITCTKSGDVIVADAENNKIIILDSKGAFVRSLGKLGSGVNDFRQPWGVALDSTDQNIHITDCGNHRVQVMNIYGRYIRTIGRGDLKSPAGIAIDANDDVYVADCDHHRIVIYNKLGTLKKVLGAEGVKMGQLSSPCDLTLDHQGNVVIAEWGNNRIQILTKEGKSVRLFGRQGKGEGDFSEPRGVAVTTDGSIVVCDCGNDRIQIF